MKILNRAKSFYSDEYFISQDIKFELEMMYLRVNGTWRECEQSTRSINFEDMIDSKGYKIFAALNKTGMGGDIVNKTVRGNTKECIAKFSSRLGFYLDTGKFSLPFSSELIFTVTGIKQ